MKNYSKLAAIKTMVAATALICFALVQAKADGSLGVPLYGQERNNWCWDASCQMILSYYGTSVSQTDIADWAVAGADIGNNLDADGIGPIRIPGTSIVLFKKGCKQVLKHFGNISSDATGALTKTQVQSGIDHSRPAILAIYWTGGGGHAIVLRGYALVGSDTFLDINDPWPQTGTPAANDPDTGSAALVLYEAIANGPANGSDNYQAIMYPLLFPSGTAAIGNQWGGTLKTTKGLDLVIAIDTTASMSDDIYQVRINAVNFVNTLAATYSDLRIAVMDYKDYPVSPYGSIGDYIARTDASFTTNTASVITAINGLYTRGGNDTPEAVYSALMYALDGSALGGWREGDDSITKRIIIMGDAPGHDPEPWPGGHNYLDVLSQAVLKKIRIDAIISGSGSSDAAALASLGALAEGSGGASYPAGIPQIANALSQISSNLTEEVRSPQGTNTSIRPVFAFQNLPATLMDAPVKKTYLEIQTKRPGTTKWSNYKKTAIKDTTYAAAQPFPTNTYRWHLSYQSSASKLSYPNGATAKIPGGSFAEESWTEFYRAFSAPGAPTLLTPSYYFAASNTTMNYTFSKALNADTYAIRIFRGYTLGTTNLFKTLTVKPPKNGTNSVLSVKVKGHKIGDYYRWQIQGLNYDRKKADPNAWED